MSNENKERPPASMHDPQLGISIRFIRQWKLEQAQRVTMHDVWLIWWLRHLKQIQDADRAFLRSLRIAPDSWT